jgi:hypothetical protein
VKISWLLRGSTWRRRHVHRCLDCGRRFCDDEPGFWAGDRGDDFPELCNSSCQRRTRYMGSHGSGCRSSGPFCPACASRIQEFWLMQREAYRD